MAREPVLAAGGIVLRREQPPRIAVVRLRKRDEWVLPKGKLDAGETARAAAEREVLEETGHDVTVHEFLGTLAYEFGGRSKIVHYWRMEAEGEQVYELMHDIRAVDWLPLEAAVTRLSRSYERAFLANVGPHALQAAALAASARRSKLKAQAAKTQMARKRRNRTIPPGPAPVEPEHAPQNDLVLPPLEPDVAPIVEVAASDPVEVEPAMDEATGDAADAVIAAQAEDVETAALLADSDDAELPEPAGSADAFEADRQRRSLAQKVREWLRRAA